MCLSELLLSRIIVLSENVGRPDDSIDDQLINRPTPAATEIYPMRLLLSLILFFLLLAGPVAQCMDATFDASIEFTYDCEGGDISVLTIVADNSSEQYFLELTNLETGNAGGFTYFSAGTYTVPIQPGNYFAEVYDQNGCQVDLGNISVSAGGPELGVIQYQPPLCAATNDGSASVIVSGGTAPYTYLWNSGSTSPSPDDLPFLSYVAVTVTDADGCTAFRDLAIFQQPPTTLGVELIEMTNPTCGGGADGTIEVAAEGGQSPYFYLWHNGEIGPVLTNVVAGFYTLTVTDDNGCVYDTTYVLDEGINPAISASNGGVIGCTTSSVTLTVSPAGPELGFVWEGPGQSGAIGNQITVDQQGTYVVTVTDGSQPDCSGVDSFAVIDESNLLDFALTGSVADCENGEFYLIEGVVLDGTGPFDYVVLYEGNFVDMGQTSDNFFQNLVSQPGFYEVILTSTTTGCSEIRSCEILPFEPVLVEFEVDTAFCAGDLANITSTIIFGNQPFSWAWSNDATTPFLFNVPGGDYEVTITDANGCTYVEEIYAGNSDDISTFYVFESPSCGESDGSVTITTFTGGTEPYGVEWSTGETTMTISGLAAGVEYGVTITDANGCEDIGSVTLTTDLEAEILVEYPANLGCDGGLPQLTASPDNDFYEYEWTGPAGFTTNAISFLAPLEGFYTLTLTDPSGNCVDSTFVQVVAIPDLELTDIVVTPVPCFGFTTLTPTYTAEIDDNFVHRWVVNGDTTLTLGEAFDAGLPGSYVYIGTDMETGCVVTDSVFLPTVGGECVGVVGTLWAVQGDCSLNGTEVPVANTLIRIEEITGSATYFVSTDANGVYSTELPFGTYEAYPLPNASDLYGDCGDVQVIHVDMDGNAFDDLFITYEEACPLMYVSVAAPNLDRCFENEVYVYYCNDGPVVAEAATITVDLDEFLFFQEASVTPASSSDHSVTFELGDLPPFACGTISLTLLVSCESELGQTHCLEATATPNDPCPEPNNWNGANLVLDAECLGDSLEFIITNDGSAPLSEALSYIIIEDGIMMLGLPNTGPVLNEDEAFRFRVPANGSTYRLEVEQEANNPNFGIPTLTVEGCGTNSSGTFSTGFVNLLPLNDSDVSWYDILCRENTGAFDPNDKMGVPLGVDEQRFIKPGTPIVYDIQFQNTGTDTARTVVLRDTIAPEFDLSTIRLGAASHDYVYAIDSGRALTITFPEIMLPDSFVNVEASQGVISYYIEHYDDLPLGTELRNQAAIYFDFNEPIFTSNTLHTLGDDFLSSLSPEAIGAGHSLAVFPNPADRNESVAFHPSVREAYHLEIYDGLGRKLMTRHSTGGLTLLDLSQQPVGWYLARLTTTDGSVIATRKFVLN
ncbi:hypothetical protein CEQ90_03935 [Lewinellaceae bacterium SD302]|nr:hypothetical protein CEQ90_03935 [Lewinellaceae bacterium SD302]